MFKNTLLSILQKIEKILWTKISVGTPYETKPKKSRKGSIVFLKSLMEGNTNLSLRKPQNTIMHC